MLQQEESAYDFRKGDLQKAKTHSWCMKNEYYTGKCRDVKIYKFFRLYRLCVIKRSQGDRGKNLTDFTVMQRSNMLIWMSLSSWNCKNLIVARRLSFSFAELEKTTREEGLLVRKVQSENTLHNT